MGERRNPRVIRVRSLAVWAAIAVRLCPAQSPVFDVASVKVARPPAGQSVNRQLGSANHGRVRLTCVTLTECIAYAYGVNSFRVYGPDWINSKAWWYDILAQ